MAVQKRQKKSGALLFSQTKEESQALKDRRKLKDMEKEIQGLKEFIINNFKDVVK